MNPLEITIVSLVVTPFLLGFTVAFIKYFIDIISINNLELYGRIGEISIE